MGYTSETVKDLLNEGVNLTITSNYDLNTLEEFVRLAKASKVNLTIKVSNYTAESIKHLAKIGKGFLTIELM
jgi:hypothetical protein